MHRNRRVISIILVYLFYVSLLVQSTFATDPIKSRFGAGSTVRGADGVDYIFGAAFDNSYSIPIKPSVLLSGNGSVSAPAHSFGTDNGIGFYLQAAGDMAFASGGKRRMSMSTDGAFLLYHDNNSIALNWNPNMGGTGAATLAIYDNGVGGGGLGLMRQTPLTGAIGIGWWDSDAAYWDLDLRNGSGDLVLGSTDVVDSTTRFRWMTGGIDGTERFAWYADNGKIVLSGGVAGDWTEPALRLKNNYFLSWRNAADTANSTFLWTDTSNDLYVGVGNTSRIHITSGGRIKIVDAYLHIPVVPTASLPAAGSVEDGSIVIEYVAADNSNLVFYSNGQRFRIDGGSPF